MSQSTLLPDNADSQVSEGTGLPGVVARLQAFNGTNWNRLTTFFGTDAMSNAQNALLVNSNFSAFNGTSWDRVRSGAAAVLSGATQPFSQLVTRPGDWTTLSSPAVNTQATVSKAAGGAGVRHVCTGISARFIGGTTAPAATQAVLNLRDGATGAGGILLQYTIIIPAVIGAKDEVNLTGLNIVGSPNTAMTIEFGGAGGANTFQSVNITGYSTV